MGDLQHLWCRCDSSTITKILIRRKNPGTLCLTVCSTPRLLSHLQLNQVQNRNPERNHYKRDFYTCFCLSMYSHQLLGRKLGSWKGHGVKPPSSAMDDGVKRLKAKAEQRYRHPRGSNSGAQQQSQAGGLTDPSATPSSSTKAPSTSPFHQDQAFFTSSLPTAALEPHYH